MQQVVKVGAGTPPFSVSQIPQNVVKDQQFSLCQSFGYKYANNDFILFELNSFDSGFVCLALIQIWRFNGQNAMLLSSSLKCCAENNNNQVDFGDLVLSAVVRFLPPRHNVPGSNSGHAEI